MIPGYFLSENSTTRDLVREERLSAELWQVRHKKKLRQQATLKLKIPLLLVSSDESEEEGMARSRTTASVDSIPPDTSSPANLITLESTASAPVMITNIMTSPVSPIPIVDPRTSVLLLPPFSDAFSFGSFSIMSMVNKAAAMHR